GTSGDTNPANVNYVPDNRLTFGLTGIDNLYIAGILAVLHELGTPYDKLYSRVLGWGLLAGFGLNEDWSTTPARPDRPFFIANGSLITRPGPSQKAWQFEYTQQYVGTPQSVVSSPLSLRHLPARQQARFRALVRPPAQVAGGGWVDVAGFDSTAPQIS